MKKLLISIACSGLLFGGLPAVYAQDEPATTTVVTQPAPDVNVKVENTQPAPAPAAAPVQIIEHTSPPVVVDKHSTSTSSKETTKIVEQAPAAASPDSNVGLFLILGGLGLVAVLALFVGAQSTKSTTTVKETFVR